MKKIGIALIFVVIAAATAYWYVFHKPHRDLQNEDLAYQLEAAALFSAFEDNQAEADSLYVDQLVGLKGKVSGLEENAILLEPGIYGSLDSNTTLPPELKVGDSLSIRGRVLSYDELFGEVKMDYVQIQD